MGRGWIPQCLSCFAGGAYPGVVPGMQHSSQDERSRPKKDLAKHDQPKHDQPKHDQPKHDQRSQCIDQDLQEITLEKGGEPDKDLQGISLEKGSAADEELGVFPGPPSVSFVKEVRGIFPLPKLVGMVLGLLLFIILMCVELSDKYPKANDMMAILALVGCFWVFEVLPLPVTSLFPLVLLPFAEIMTSKAASSSYWNWIQMLFLGAFMVDTAIQEVDLHRRIALGVLLKIGVKYPAVVLFSFSLIGYCMSMWCTNTATAVMLMPFAKGVLDSAQFSSTQHTPESKEKLRKYNVGVLLGLAYACSCGGIATSIGTPPNGVLAGIPLLNNMVTAADWLAFAFPVSAIAVVIAILSVYFLYVRGCVLEMDREVLVREYASLGKLNRDEVVVAVVQILQILLWLVRKDLINKAMGIKGVNDATIACGAAAILFFIPSVKRPGKTVLTWEAAQSHLPWGVLLLMGGGFAIADGFKASKLTNFIGEELAWYAKSPKLLVTYLMVLCVTFLTEVTSNTATANVMLPILASVAEETLTHPLALMLPATVACSFAFMFPAATPPNAVAFASQRIRLGDMIKAGIVINLFMVLVGSLIIWAMGMAVYDTAGPYPKWACQQDNCVWVNVAGMVAGRAVDSQACRVIDEASCRLFDGRTIPRVPMH